MLYKPTSHELFKGFTQADDLDGEDTQRFIKRANREFEQLGSKESKIALDYAGDAYPAEMPEKSNELNRVSEDPYFHRPPEHEPSRGEYYFVFANGQIEASPFHDHRELADQAGVDLESSGPLAVGFISVDTGMAHWSVQSNVGAKAISKKLRDYTKQVGWNWGGMTDLEGEPIGTGSEFAPKKGGQDLWFRFTNAKLLIGPRDADLIKQAVASKATEIDVAESVFGRLRKEDDVLRLTHIYKGPRFFLSKHRERLKAVIGSLQEYAEDQGLTLVSGLPGDGWADAKGGVGDNVIKRIEDLELDNLYDPNPKDEGGQFFPKIDEREPSGLYKCRHCGKLLPTWRAYVQHLQEEEPLIDEEPKQDGHFPELPDQDDPIPAHQTEQKPEIMPMASVTEARRVDGFKTYAKAFGFDDDNHRHYVAFRAGSPIGYASISADGVLKSVHVNEPVTHHIMNRVRRDYGELTIDGGGNFTDEWMKHAGFTQVNTTRWRYAKDQPATDMLEAEVPFIFDIDEDSIHFGEPGQRTSDIMGPFTPGGIVEGTYEPGGKVYLNTETNMPYSIRHLVDLWYAQHPHLEVKGIIKRDGQGNETKLAQEQQTDIGTAIQTEVAADAAASTATIALMRAGGKVYAVGGAVRDAVMGKTPKDIDLMVSGLSADDVQAVLGKLSGRLDYTGKDFGVFRLRMGDDDVEVALPRRERSTGDAHTDFDVQSDHTMSAEEDLYRRDFTANAMAVDLKTGELIDPYGGSNDIADGRLKTVHEHALAEDPLRTVRALVAHGRHGLEPDEGTRAQMAAHGDKLNELPPERIQAELDKIMESNDPAAAMRLAHQTGILRHILPEVDDAMGYDQNNPHHEQELGEHLLSVLDRASKLNDDPDVRLAALLHDIGKPGSAWVDPETGKNHFYRSRDGQGANHEELGAEMAKTRLEQLRYPQASVKRVSDLVLHHMFPWFSTDKGARRFVNRVGDYAEDLMDIREADNGGKTAVYDTRGNLPAIDKQREMLQRIREGGDATDRTQLAINGHDLTNLGLQGPAIGAELQRLTELVVDDPSLNNRDALLGLVNHA
jgi:tRNA nucleotidyltransferase (CCA-adding enzyme)